MYDLSGGAVYDYIKGILKSSSFTETTKLSHTSASCVGSLETFKSVVAKCLYLNLLEFDAYSIEVGLGLSGKDFGFNSYK